MLVGGSGASTRARPRTRRLRLVRDTSSRRTLAVLLVFAVLFVAVGYRLVRVQVVNADEFARLGAAQRSRIVELPAQRGRIYDRNGDVLATSIDGAAVYADPRAYRPRERGDGLLVPPAAEAADVARRLAPILGRDEAALRESLTRDAHFVYLGRQLPGEVGDAVRELDLPGVGVLTEPLRRYPNGGLAAQVVGFTGIDGDGLAGLELQFDELLTGEPGTLALERAPGGLSIASAPRELEPAEAGTDLVLTLDREIQHVAERAATTAAAEFEAKGVGVVVLEVGTGEVLAMASTPGFDPNHLEDSDAAQRRNRAVTDMFEPGSVQKAITAAAALEDGVATPGTTFEVADTLKWGRKTFSDSHEHETRVMTLTEIVAESSNVGTILLADRLGPDRLSHYLDEFGYGAPLGVDFPGEGAGAVLPREAWSATSLPTIAIGQGVAVTLLQAANAYQTLANDGVATAPRLVRGTVGEDGRLEPSGPGETRQVVSAATARQVTDMLRRVVTAESGTGKAAAVPGYAIAGKTGTARKPLEDARGYSSEYIASFVGYAPADDPRIVVAVMVDEPWPIWGGVVAAPAFSEVMGFALAHRRVPPTDAGG